VGAIGTSVALVLLLIGSATAADLPLLPLER
jgi:hypothetical protein